MLKPMSDNSLDTALMLAIYRPDQFGALTPRRLCERFGVPSPGQLEILQEVVVYDERGRFRALAPTSIETEV